MEFLLSWKGVFSWKLTLPDRSSSCPLQLPLSLSTSITSIRKVGHAGMERQAQLLAYGKQPAGSLVTWTSPVLYQISLSHFLADYLLAKPQKEPQLYKCEAPLLGPRGCPARDFLLTETQEAATQGCAG